MNLEVRRPRLPADHPWVLEGAKRPSALLRHTRSWTCASPRAARSSTGLRQQFTLTRIVDPASAALGEAILRPRQELLLPTTHRLLRDLPVPGGLSQRHLTTDHRQHKANLLLGRYRRRSSHQIAPFSGARLYDPANILEARQTHPPYDHARHERHPHGTHWDRASAWCTSFPATPLRASKQR